MSVCVEFYLYPTVSTALIHLIHFIKTRIDDETKSNSVYVQTELYFGIW